MRVVFIQKFVPHYRRPFFERVKQRLNDNGIEFLLLHARPDPFEASKVKMDPPPWATEMPTRHLTVAGRYLYWTGAMRYLRKGDFVVVEHAAKLLDNYIVFAARQIGYLKMGYFGHGENFQATTEFRVSALVKKIMLKVDRWFAYTEVSRASLLRQQVPDERITVVNNTLQQSANAALATNAPEPCSCVFIGGMYDLKLLPFLIEACDRVVARLPDFRLHLVGDGPEKNAMIEASKTRSWLEVHGSLYGEERDRMLARCNAILMPGLVGLIAIDSFQFARPLITSDAGEHSPEIAYLEHGVNCLIDQGDVTAESYADLVLHYLQDESVQKSLKSGCKRSNEDYSIENMAENFCRPFLTT